MDGLEYQFSIAKNIPPSIRGYYIAFEFISIQNTLMVVYWCVRLL